MILSLQETKKKRLCISICNTPPAMLKIDNWYFFKMMELPFQKLDPFPRYCFLPTVFYRLIQLPLERCWQAFLAFPSTTLYINHICLMPRWFFSKLYVKKVMSLFEIHPYLPIPLALSIPKIYYVACYSFLLTSPGIFNSVFITQEGIVSILS